jgi:hypothetical protein
MKQKELTGLEMGEKNPFEGCKEMDPYFRHFPKSFVFIGCKIGNPKC